MYHAESADDELAIIRRKLERATKQLAEKDLEITVLKKGKRIFAEQKTDGAEQNSAD